MINLKKHFGIKKDSFSFNKVRYTKRNKYGKLKCENCGRWVDEREFDWSDGTEKCRYCKND
jgi:formylmethanofuran dehydrogenase subunit E